MQICVAKCSTWKGQGRDGLIRTLVDENALNSIINNNNNNNPVAHNYACGSAFISTISRRLRRFFEQPTVINYLLTDIWATLLQVSGVELLAKGRQN